MKLTRKQIAKEMRDFGTTLRAYGVSLEELENFARNKNTAEIQKEPTILDIAGELVNGERNRTYKHPNENFRNIKNLWNAYNLAIKSRPDQPDANHVDNPITCYNEFDVAMLMVLMKVARLATNNTHKDSLIDIAGYARCAERVLTNK